MRITENYSGVPARELFAFAERENNPKRRNLIVNLLQAKHFPALPSQTLELFGRLGEKAGATLPAGKTLVIAFAETATALGAAAAAELAGMAMPAMFILYIPQGKNIPIIFLRQTFPRNTAMR
ncbi:MAG: phosphoribosyltransferase domain-containing protein [Ruminococcus sp.]|nr:phosphoribosyltransferase domain-containing protein [Ruminococcus sp.]